MSNVTKAAKFVYVDNGTEWELLTPLYNENFLKFPEFLPQNKLKIILLSN